MIKKILTLGLLSLVGLQASTYTYNQLNTATDKLVKNKINKKNCDKILTNKNYFTTCYDYKLKSSIFAYTKIYADKINKKNIKKRPRFYEDLNIPKKYRTKSSDFTRTGYDRGHGIANDSSWDWSKKSQKMTYVMSQIWPQYPKTNRYSYLTVEKQQRKITKNLGVLEIFIETEFNKNPKKIGRSKLSVPSGFFIMYWNNKKNFKECYFVPNDNKVYKLKEMKINCRKMR